MRSSISKPNRIPTGDTIDSVDIAALIKGGDIDVASGEAAEAVRVLNVFDRYDPARAVVVPSSLMQDHM